MILCVSMNPAVDKMLKIKSINVGKVNRAMLESVHAGGKAINVAFDLLVQGEEPYVTGFVGGKTGTMITEELKQRQMPYEFVKLASETRTNMNYIDEHGRVTEILETGHLVDAESERNFISVYQKLLKKADMVVLSGSIPVGLPDEMYGILIDMANKERIPVCLDASNEALSIAVEHAPFMIKPNLSELENLTSHKYDLSKLDESIEAFFKDKSFRNVLLPDLTDLLNKGILIVCVTLGEKGLILYARDRLILCKAPKVDVINTVGSGDCTLAALIHSLKKNAPLLDSAVYATAVSSAHVTTMNVADVDPRLVISLTEQVKYGVYKVVN